MFILEGNNGVGKSTFLKIMQEHAPDIAVIQESVENWSFQLHGQSLLGNFYQHPTRWAYTMETFTMLTRVREYMHHQRHAQPMSLMERSVYSCHYCFAKNGQAEGFFTPIEWEVYSRWIDFMLLANCQPPRGFIYLRTDPETCFQRLRERARVGEEAVTLAYMQQLHDWHEKYLISREGVDPAVARVPVLVLDASVDLRQHADAAVDYVKRTRAFMQQLTEQPVVPGALVQPARVAAISAMVGCK